MTSGSKLLAVVALVSLLTYPALGLEVSQDKGINEPQLEARGTRRNLAAKTAIRKSKLPRKSDAEAQLSFGDKEETTLRMHSPHDVHKFAGMPPMLNLLSSCQLRTVIKTLKR